MADTKLAVGAAVNVLFWREVASAVIGRRYGWVGVAGSLAAMVSAKDAKGPVVPLLNLPGSIAANVLGLQGCGCKGSKTVTDPPDQEPPPIVCTEGSTDPRCAVPPRDPEVELDRESILEHMESPRGL